MHDPNRILLNKNWILISRNESADRRICPLREKLNILRYSILFKFPNDYVLLINRRGALNRRLSNLLFGFKKPSWVISSNLCTQCYTIFSDKLSKCPNCEEQK